VDSKDFRLLAALFVDPRQSFRALGRGVGLTAPAVRDRLRRLEALGILRGYSATPDASLFGRENRVVLFHGTFTREQVVGVAALPDVVWVAWKYDGGLSVELWSRAAGESVAAVQRTLGVPPAFETVGAPPEPRSVTTIDWRILAALVEDARIGLGALCRQTHLTAETVRRHLEGLLADHMVVINPQLGPLSGSGDLVFTVTVLGPIPFAEIRRILGDAALLRRVAKPPAQYVLGRAASLGEVTDRTAALLRHPEVRSAFVSLNREHLINREFVRNLVRHQLRLGELARVSEASGGVRPRKAPVRGRPT
jgi:DNA-binding Lrp family transcriptional regulator